MKEHIEDILVGGRPMTKNEIKIKELQDRIDKAIEILKDSNVDMDSILLCETIGYAIHILEGSDKE